MRASAAPALRVALPRAAMRASALQRCSAAARAPTTQRPSFGACRPRRAAGSVRVRAEGDAAASPPPEPSAPPPGASGNTALAGAAVAAGVALFVLTRATGGVSLAALQAESVPIEQALRNGRPTVVEFYADWCEVCRETAPNIADVERSLKDRLNFVMLNVDNAKWAPEMSEYDVDGIPHFVFLDATGRKQGQVVGRLPKEVLKSNADALVAGGALPYSKAAGATSGVAAPDARVMASGAASSDPRAHSWN